MIGTTLSHYRILEEIGAGGMGVVYRAHDDRLERDVAVKVLPAGALAGDAQRRRFHREALALSRLNHPGVTTVHDFDREGGADLIVVELVTGNTLATRLKGGALPPEQVTDLGIQIAEALEAAPARGRCCHRSSRGGAPAASRPILSPTSTSRWETGTRRSPGWSAHRRTATA